MITLTRLSGSQFLLNSDLIERVDATPDTVITLVDGKKYVVAERPLDIVAAVREHRGQILALSNDPPSEEMFAQRKESEPTHLAPVASLRADQHKEA